MGKMNFREGRRLNGYRILIVEDDGVIAGAVERQLKSWGYAARCVEDFNHVMAAFAAFDPQLVLMDISLPFFNGFHWCGEIRKVSKVPILFLSSASDNMNLILAVNMGGDDFLAKPFEMAVLTAKVQALLRRTYDFGIPSCLMECGGGMLNVSDGTLSVDGERVELTKNELRILRLLLENRGRIVTREELMNALWQSDEFVDENTLSVNVNRLRRKLTAAGLDEEFIRTRKGAGYLIG
jgi:two-component system response regulator protein BraR/BceR